MSCRENNTQAHISDMLLFDIGATVEAAVRGLSVVPGVLIFTNVHGDPSRVRAGSGSVRQPMEIPPTGHRWTGSDGWHPA
jgi:hypothetical protein